MIGLKLDILGRREFRLFEDTEIIPIRPPLAQLPEIETHTHGPTILSFPGSDGASSLDNYPVAEQRIRTKYGCPDIPGRVVSRLRGRMNEITRNAYRSIRRKMGSYLADQSRTKYIAAVNAFTPHVETINGAVIPMGNTDAFYSPHNNAAALDEGAIYGTRKNKILRSLYKSGLKAARRIPGRFGENMREYLSGILNKLEDRDSEVNTMIHEKIHKVVDTIKLADYLSVEENEGITCAAATEIAGKCTTIRNSTYRDFMNRAYRALRSIGYRGRNSATMYIRDYASGNASGKSYVRAFRRAA